MWALESWKNVSESRKGPENVFLKKGTNPVTKSLTIKFISLFIIFQGELPERTLFFDK